MSTRLVQISAGLIFGILAAYLLLPSPKFPPLPPGSIQSTEPGDTESVNRAAYYSNLSREEVEGFYFRQFGGWGIRQILPPEEAQSLVRDQTRSSYLEEIIHPARESLYVNAFVPTLPQDEIRVNGVKYLNKITVRYVPSQPISRLTVLLMTVVTAYLLVKEYVLA